MLETRPFDPADYIRSSEEAGFYMEAALAGGDTLDVIDALDVIARALGKEEPQLPEDASLHRIVAALKALGLRLAVQPAEAPDSQAAAAA